MEEREQLATLLTAPGPAAGIVDLTGWAGPWSIQSMVVDTGMILNSIFRGIRWGEDQRFLAVAASGIVRIFVPDAARQGVEDQLKAASRWCRKRRLEVALWSLVQRQAERKESPGMYARQTARDAAYRSSGHRCA